MKGVPAKSTEAFNQIDDMHRNKDLKIHSKDSDAI